MSEERDAVNGDPDAPEDDDEGVEWENDPEDDDAGEDEEDDEGDDDAEGDDY